MNRCLIGDCLDVLPTLEAGSVQTCVTSPPYWGLRDYGVAGQLGLESTPDEYVAKMVAVFREVKRLLRDDGTCWINLGDSYARTGGEQGGGIREMLHMDGTQKRMTSLPVGSNLKPKDLCGIPWRVAFALQADGWYLRQDIIWSKPNCMPESVRDRCTKAHEYIFLLSKRERYYFDCDAIAEPYLHEYRVGPPSQGKEYSVASGRNDGGQHRTGAGMGAADGTRNKRSVWTVSTKPFSGAHFATFPPDLIEPCILAGTSQGGCCSKCGAPRQRITERGDLVSVDGTKADYRPKKATDDPKIKGRSEGWTPNHMRPTVTTGWRADCDCSAETVPCVVLDPFFGSGTTGQVAQALGRQWVGIELNPAYATLQNDRTSQQGMVLV